MFDFKMYRVARIGVREVTHGGECDYYEGYVSNITRNGVHWASRGEMFFDKTEAMQSVLYANDVETDVGVRYELETIECEIVDEKE